MNTSQSNFCFKLDTLLLPNSVDAIVVLRHITPEQTRARFDLGASLMQRLHSNVLLMPYVDSTAQEARSINNICINLRYRSVLLVTHKYHSYRAFLTFIAIDSPIRYYMATVSGELQYNEFLKIEAYKKKGDVASYEKGLEYLNGN